MRSFLVTAVSASALALVLTSIGPAQEAQTPRGPSQTPPATNRPPQIPAGYVPAGSDPNEALPPLAPPDAVTRTTPRPVAEVKKRYQATQERLQQLAKGGEPSLVQSTVGSLKLEDRDPRDRLRAAVADDFDARRELQQAELAELEGRVVRIKRALEIRDAMRDTIIDQRTEELLGQIDEGGESGERGAAQGSGRASYPHNKGGAVVPLGESGADAVQAGRLLKADVDEAKANLESAERAYDRVKRMHASGAVSQEILDEQADKLKQAKLQLDRALVKIDAFLELHRSSLPAAKDASAGDGAVIGH
jgi:hypothetical protein